jgi:hypothetical protein
LVVVIVAPTKPFDMDNVDVKVLAADDQSFRFFTINGLSSLSERMKTLQESLQSKSILARTRSNARSGKAQRRTNPRDRGTRSLATPRSTDGARPAAGGRRTGPTARRSGAGVAVTAILTSKLYVIETDFEVSPDAYNNLQAMLDEVREKYGLDFLILEPGFKLKRFDDY